MKFLVLAMAIFGFVFGDFAAVGEARAETAHRFTFQSIDGDEIRLADYAGRPVLVVNTASRCGFTHQYTALQTLWARYRDRGLVVIGVPSADFRQELSSEAEVKAFCEVNFGIDFPMTEITKVRGRAAAPFFQWAGAPRWNFFKYLIGPDGALIGTWPSMIPPTSAQITDVIDQHIPPAAAIR